MLDFVSKLWLYYNIVKINFLSFLSFLSKEFNKNLSSYIIQISNIKLYIRLQRHISCICDVLWTYIVMSTYLHENIRIGTGSYVLRFFLLNFENSVSYKIVINYIIILHIKSIINN